MFNGRVFGETKSSVRAHIDNGVFTGSIVLPDETYHIEVSFVWLKGVFFSYFDIPFFSYYFRSRHGDIYLIYRIDI